MRIVAGLLFLGAMLAVTSFSTAQPPGGQPGQPGKGGGFGKGVGGPAIGQILPAFLQEMLKMTDAQKKDLEALQKDVDAKLDKILTDDQKKQLKDLREGKGGFGGGPGGKGFPGKDGEKGGFPGKGGEKGGDKKGDKGNPPPA